MSAQHTPGPVLAQQLSVERSYAQWRELHALNGLARPREWHELSEARQRVWRATLRCVYEDGIAIGKATRSAS